MDPSESIANDDGLPKIPTKGAVDYRSLVFEFLADYGWFVLIGIALAAYLWKRIMEQQNQSSGRSSTGGMNPISVAAMKKDDDANTIVSRHEAMLAARQRMQEQQDRLSAVAKEEMAKREEEKRMQKIQDWETHKQGGGYRNKTHAPEESGQASSSKKPQAKKTPFRQSDYNPLTGTGGGTCGYRPARRGFGGGGGG